jgi:preprotein translocase subunit SecA
VKADTVQRDLAFAVVDEADSILIDEARSPLIISMGQPTPCREPAPYLLADEIARMLKAIEDFASDPATGRLQLTDSGRMRAYAALTDDALAPLRRVWTTYVEQALQANYRFHRDVHYIVREGKVVIVDEFTGRPCPDRTWRDGLHQAVEAAAEAEITEENASEATITRPAYFRLYDRICGMTGTAAEAAAELRESYSITTRIIPLNEPCRRLTLPDRVFVDRPAKLRAVAAEIAARHANDQPILVGTRTVANSEELAAVLGPSGLTFRLLNARQDAEEADIIARAGEPGAITIATNMAGRGAHIPLPPESERAGGLHVIGLERHESARIDRQLIGRAARQGQPGSAQFFLSLDDELLRRHAPAIAAKLAKRTASPAGELPCETAVHFLRAQRKVERADRASRRALADYDKWLDELKQAL